jgi:glutamyl-tRNA synthetase
MLAVLILILLAFEALRPPSSIQHRPMPRTRLAPSPTGALHLGNARTFLVNWALARQQGWQIVLRIEDLDGPRVKADAAAEAIDVLEWLGLDWDEGPHYQRSDLTPYRSALHRLAAQGDIYPCRCTRRDFEAASLSAPHGDEHELRYPGTCRPADRTPVSPEQLDDPGVAWRLRVPEGVTTFVDEFAGRHEYDVQATSGDFLVATKEGLPSYQLAVVVDDARQGIDRVVRGDDLLGSTHRQLLLKERLGLSPPRQYVHLPLVVGADGRRLAKRHGDSRISHYRAQGVSTERILGLISEWCGLDVRRELTATEFQRNFQLDRLPRSPVVFTSEDDRWLLDSNGTS